MGGVVAQLALTLGVSDLVDVVITMSTPHLLPAVTFEYGMEVIYRSVAEYVNNDSTPLLFSLCGGVSDTQIVSDACGLPSTRVSASDGFAVFTTGIPGVWTGVDHQAMVWCHQLRWRVARVILEMTTSAVRKDKLATARRWFLGEVDRDFVRSEDPNLSKTAAKEFPVTSTAMTAYVWSASSDFGNDRPAIRVQWCRPAEDCQDIVATTEAVPRMTDSTVPFPLPGEGVKAQEIAFALDMRIHAPDGVLVLDVPNGTEVHVGQRYTEVVRGKSWSEPPLVCR